MVVPASWQPMISEVNFTKARNLTPLFNEVVRKDHPVMIVRGGHERGVLLSLDVVKRALSTYRFHVDVLPEDDGGYTLWVRELNIGESGATLLDARRALLSAIRFYVKDYIEEFDFYRHMTDLAQQEPYVLRLSLAQSDNDLIEILFGSEQADDECFEKG